MLLDSSALLAYILGEPGQERVGQELEVGAVMSAVNLAEVGAKLADLGFNNNAIESVAGVKKVTIVDVDRQIALQAGLLRRVTRQFGLSLGDRCCLATALDLGTSVLTADRIWANLDLGVQVEICR